MIVVLEKTTLDDLIVRYNNSEVNVDITINSELEIVSYSNMGKTVLTLLKDMHDKIVILDEYYLFQTPVFSKAYKQYAVENNLWFVLMTREETSRQRKQEGKLVNTLSLLSYSVYSIYKLVMKDNIITNQPYYAYPNYTKISNIDCILVEDTTAGYCLVISSKNY